MFYIIYAVMNKRYAAGPYREDEVMSQYHDLQYEGVMIEKIISENEFNKEEFNILIS